MGKRRERKKRTEEKGVTEKEEEQEKELREKGTGKRKRKKKKELKEKRMVGKGRETREGKRDIGWERKHGAAIAKSWVQTSFKSALFAEIWKGKRSGERKAIKTKTCFKNEVRSEIVGVKR